MVELKVTLDNKNWHSKELKSGFHLAKVIFICSDLCYFFVIKTKMKNVNDELLRDHESRNPIGS